MTPPIRFLALVVGGWGAARVIALLPTAEARRAPFLPADVTGKARYATSAPENAFAKPTHPSSTLLAALPRSARDARPGARSVSLYQGFTRATAWGAEARLQPASLAVLALPRTHPAAVVTTTGEASGARAATSPKDPGAAIPSFAAASVRPRSRLTGSVWALARGTDVAAVATNGLLGGSQAGGRLLYRVNDEASQPVSITARLSGPLRRKGVEAAVGVEWQPAAGLPVRILAERRQRVNGDGRSAFALLAHGGLSDRPVAAGMKFDAYLQAGIVGARRRDLFADGGATLVRPLQADRPLGPAIGAGIWGGAQPRAARLDIGPRLTTMLGGAPLRARVSLDWRFRVAGKAAPASGPSLTIGTDF